MAHDARQTQVYIDDALSRFSAIADSVDRDRHAFAYLRARRRRGDDPLARSLGIIVAGDPSAPYDESLADAEHYMYARFLANSTGDSATPMLVRGYQLKKKLDFWRGNGQSMKTDPRFPVLPPDPASEKWGLKGADDGLQEYKTAHGGNTGSYGSAIKANSGMIY